MIIEILLVFFIIFLISNHHSTFQHFDSILKCLFQNEKIHGIFYTIFHASTQFQLRCFDNTDVSLKTSSTITHENYYTQFFLTRFLPNAHYDCAFDVRLSIILRHQFLLTTEKYREKFQKQNSTTKIENNINYFANLSNLVYIIFMLPLFGTQNMIYNLLDVTSLYIQCMFVLPVAQTFMQSFYMRNININTK